MQNALWALSQTGILTLLVLLIRSGNHKNYPWFTVYQAWNLLQAGILLLTYHFFGISSETGFIAYWTTQGLVLTLRGLAVTELCRAVLARYTGIWTLAMRILLACATLIIGYAVAVSNWHGSRAVVAASRGLELAIAGIVVSLILFSRYYKIPVSPQNRSMATGFCLYSCAVVLHNTFGNPADLRLFYFYSIGLMAVFCASLTIWGLALRLPAPAQEQIPALLGADSYQQLSPAINARLRLLNDRLISAWKVETPLP